jgi:hypothetical protein
MPNNKAIGVAYADPQFDSVDVTGAINADSATVTGAVTAASAAVSGAVTGATFTGGFTSNSTSGQLVGNAAGGVYFLSTAITNNVTTTSAPAGSLGLTSNATGVGILFVSDGTKWQLAAITQP